MAMPKGRHSEQLSDNLLASYLEPEWVWVKALWTVHTKEFDWGDPKELAIVVQKVSRMEATMVQKMGVHSADLMADLAERVQSMAFVLEHVFHAPDNVTSSWMTWFVWSLLLREMPCLRSVCRGPRRSRRPWLYPFALFDSISPFLKKLSSKCCCLG